MALSSLPLSYCTNVHPARTLEETVATLFGPSAPASRVRQQRGQTLGVGLWLPRSVACELAARPEQLAELAARLADADMVCYTLNAFPFGDFHAERVKESVYRPEWTEAARLDYTAMCAELLAGLLPTGMSDGSLSSLPLSFKSFHPNDPTGRATVWPAAVANLVELAARLDSLYRRTGKRIRLALEPEPLCTLETLAETAEFFAELFRHADLAARGPAVREFVGVCLDVCHSAVEFEDIADGVRALSELGVRLNKVHVTSALELREPGNNIEGRARLASFAEPRYLHQVFARSSTGNILRCADLSRRLAEHPEPDWHSAEVWRIHFHVPVGAENLGPLATTHATLCEALSAVAQLPYDPHLEVETYTWGVLPEADRLRLAPDLATGLTAEMRATDGLIAEFRAARTRPASASSTNSIRPTGID